MRAVHRVLRSSTSAVRLVTEERKKGCSEVTKQVKNERNAGGSLLLGESSKREVPRSGEAAIKKAPGV